MLTPLVLGGLALAVFWQTTLLVSWATVREVTHDTDPRRAAQIRWVVAGMLLGAAACTTLALWPPVFGRISTVGGLAGLAFFLLVQPLGTALRDHARAGRLPSA
jgi:hypothetical protein